MNTLWSIGIYVWRIKHSFETIHCGVIASAVCEAIQKILSGQSHDKTARHNNLARTALSVLFLFSLSGCLYQKPVVPKVKIPENFKNSIKTTNSKINEKWWKDFGDEQLNQLVDLGLQNNINYLIALKNIRIARTYVFENMSSLFPQLNLNYGLSRNSQSLNTSQPISKNAVYNLNQLNASVSYELDVWNRIKNSISQARANVEASTADSNVVLLGMISNIVNTYWQIAALNSNISNLQKQNKLAEKIIKLNQTQYRSGLIDIEPVDNAKTQKENIKSAISALEKQRQILQNTLAYLVGLYPEEFDLKTGKLVTTKQLIHMIPPALPAKILINRPDIQENFYQVLSYGYAQKEALSAFFPTFSLTGQYGFASSSFSNFITTGGKLWNLGVGVSQLIFDYAKTSSQYKRAKLQYESSILSYKNTLLNAFQEVNNALVSYQQDSLALNAATNTRNNTQDKFNVAKAQYDSKIDDYIAYLEYELAYLQAEYNVTNQKQILISDIVQVYKTLGIGW